jgi:hypothetical protein
VQIKSETVWNYVLALTSKVNQPGYASYRMFDEHAMDSLVRDLEKFCGLGERLEEIRYTIDCRPIGHFSASDSEFFRQFRIGRPETPFLLRKLRQILGADVHQKGRYVVVRTSSNRVVRIALFAPRQSQW